MHLIIEGMSCGHCTAAVDKAIRAVEGVDEVSVSLDPGEAIIVGTAKADAVIQAVVEEGYEAREG